MVAIERMDDRIVVGLKGTGVRPFATTVAGAVRLKDTVAIEGVGDGIVGFRGTGVRPFATTAAGAACLKDVVAIEAHDGIGVGLNGTGDGRQIICSARGLINLLACCCRFGVLLPFWI